MCNFEGQRWVLRDKISDCKVTLTFDFCFLEKYQTFWRYFYLSLHIQKFWILKMLKSSQIKWYWKNVAFAMPFIVKMNHVWF